MKKIISICLIYMLCCAFCGTVSAASAADSLFIYDDMEKGTASYVSVLANNTGATYGITQDPTERSKFVYKVSIDPKKSGNYSYVSPVKNKSIPVKMGASYKTSLMVYMDTAVPRSKDAAIVYELIASTIDTSGNPSKQMVSASYEIPLQIDWKIGTWTRIQGIVNWSETLPYAVSTSTPLNGRTIDFSNVTLTRMYFRIGNNANNTPIVDRNALVGDAQTFDFYFDEMVYEPCQKTDIPPLAYGENILTYGDFEAGTTKGFSVENGSMIASIKRDRSPVSGDTGRFLNIANTADTFARNELSYYADEHTDISLLPNRMYEFSFWYRVNELYDEAGSCGYNPAASETPAKGDVYIRWHIGDGTGENEKIDLNGIWTTENSLITKCPQEDVLILDGKWHEAEISFRFDAKTFAKLSCQGEPIRASLIFRAHQNNAQTPMHMDMDIDDIKLIDHGPLANGDFERQGGYALRWYNGSGTGAVALPTTYSVYGWLGDGCRLYQSDVVRSNPLTGSEKSMQVILNAGGRPLQSMSMTEKGRYKLSFWAMDDTLADGESMPFAAVLDRSSRAGDQENEVYSVPDYEFYTGTYEKVSGGWIYNQNVMANQEWRITNEWQYFETYISNDFPFIDGKEDADTAHILPRQPFLFFVYNGSNPEGVTYYLDDVKLEKAPDALPEVKNIKIHGVADPGGVLSVSYDFVHPLGIPEGESFVHVYSDGAAVETFPANGGTYTVKESDIGKSLSFEVVPMDIENRGGEAVLTKNVETTWTWSKLYLGEDGASARAYTGEAQEATFLFASYQNNRLIDMKTVTADLLGDHRQNSVSVVDFIQNGADTVKVMLWNGIDKAKPIAMLEKKTK